MDKIKKKIDRLFLRYFLRFCIHRGLFILIRSEKKITNEFLVASMFKPEETIKREIGLDVLNKLINDGLIRISHKYSPTSGYHCYEASLIVLNKRK